MHLVFISKLQLYRKNNKIIKHAISAKLLELCKIINIINSFLHFPEELIYALDWILDGHFKNQYDMYHIFGIPYEAIFSGILMFTSTFIDIFLLFSYVRALHIYNKFWCRIDDNNEPNPLQHEQLLVISRYCVVFGISIFLNILNNISEFIVEYTIHKSSDDTGTVDTFNVGIILYVVWEAFHIFNILSYIIAIYVSYEFSYYQYQVFCGFCHKICFKCCSKITMYQYHTKWDKWLAKEGRYRYMKYNIDDVNGMNDIPYHRMK